MAIFKTSHLFQAIILGWRLSVCFYYLCLVCFVSNWASDGYSSDQSQEQRVATARNWWRGGLITMSPSSNVCRSLGHHWRCQMRRQMWPLNTGCDGEGGGIDSDAIERVGAMIDMKWNEMKWYDMIWYDRKVVVSFSFCFVNGVGVISHLINTFNWVETTTCRNRICEWNLRSCKNLGP